MGWDNIYLQNIALTFKVFRIGNKYFCIRIFSWTHMAGWERRSTPTLLERGLWQWWEQESITVRKGVVYLSSSAWPQLCLLGHKGVKLAGFIVLLCLLLGQAKELICAGLMSHHLYEREADSISAQLIKSIAWLKGVKLSFWVHRP